MRPAGEKNVIVGNSHRLPCAGKIGILDFVNCTFENIFNGKFGHT